MSPPKQYKNNTYYNLQQQQPQQQEGEEKSNQKNSRNNKKKKKSRTIQAQSSSSLSSRSDSDHYNDNDNENNTTTTTPPSLIHEEKRIIRKLATRDYHLPQNTSWKQDLIQFICNTHPVLGLCCSHPLHPLRKMTDRLFCLVGSVAFGLAATNAIYLYYEWTRGDMNRVVFCWDVFGDDDNDDDDDDNDGNNDANNDGGEGGVITTTTREGYHTITITSGMVALWTFGGIIHSWFDLMIWYVLACPCFRPGGIMEQWGKQCGGLQFGRHVAFGIVWIAGILALGTVVLRASWEARMKQKEEETQETTSNQEENDDEEDDLIIVDDVENFSFLLGYLVEVLLALFVYYPCMACLLFSGVLGCFRIPVLGGRPYELRRERAYQEKRNGRILVDDECDNDSTSE